MVLTAEANSRYFDAPTWPGDEESCPAPRNMQNDRGVFSSPAKLKGVYWTGVLLNGVMERAVTFEKAVFVLTEKYSENRGFLSSCIYATSEGRYLHMRLDAGNRHDEVMWIARSLSWSKTQEFSSGTILECTDKGERACGFFLK